MPSTNVSSRELVHRFTQELDQLLAGLSANSPAAGLGVPEVDIRKENGTLFLVLPAPGAQIEDIRVSITQGMLTIAIDSTRSGREDTIPLPH